MLEPDICVYVFPSVQQSCVHPHGGCCCALRFLECLAPLARVANPLYAPARSVVVEVELEDGTVGIGVSIGGAPACYLIEKHLSRFVVGQVI